MQLKLALVAVCLIAGQAFAQSQQPAGSQQNFQLVEVNLFNMTISRQGVQQPIGQQSGQQSGQQQQENVGDLIVYGINPVFNSSVSQAQLQEIASGGSMAGPNAPQPVATIAGFCIRIVASNQTGGQANQTGGQANQTGGQANQSGGAAAANQTGLFPTGQSGPIGISQCLFTLAQTQLDTVQFSGMVLDSGNSTLAVLGGTGIFEGAGGQVIQMRTKGDNLVQHQISLTGLQQSA